MVDGILALLPNLKVEVLGSVVAKGQAKAASLDELTQLAELIYHKHRDI